MTNCCNAYGQCEHGPDCQVGPATLLAEPKPLARTCETLGVCRHPLRECQGACEQTPRLNFWLDAAEPQEDPALLRRDGFMTAVLFAATVGVTLGVVFGLVRFVGWLA